MAYRLTHDKVQSQDLVQETILRCLIRSWDPEEIKAPLAYLFQCMRTAWIDSQRKNKKYEVVSLDDPLNNELLEAKLIVESDVLRSLENEELMKTLKANVGRLTASEKQLLDLWLRAFTADEIARELAEDVRVIRYELNALMAKIRYRLKHNNKRSPLKNMP